jgi:hypothetical protein
VTTWPTKQVEFGYPAGRIPSPLKRRKRAPERDPRQGGHPGAADVSSNRSRTRQRNRKLMKIERESRRLNQHGG